VNVVIVPPHADFTLEWPAPEGFETVDAARFFVAAALEPGRLRLKADAFERQGTGGETSRAVVLLRAAAELLEAGGGDAHRHLRACGAGLAGGSTVASPVRVRLDDVELPGGTTERSRDLPGDLEALDALYGHGLSHALRHCGESTERVRLRLDRDQQVPAVVALARELEGRARVEVTGAFAVRHWAALSRLPGFSGVALHVEEDSAPRVAGSPLLSSADPCLLWVDDPYHLRIPRGGPWGGVIPFGALANPQALIASGCRLVVVTFCALGEQAVGADGQLLRADVLAAGVEALRAAGVRPVGEWWIGAPGVGEEALERTLQILEQAPPFDGLTGVRAFHWPAHRGAEPWGGVQVIPGPVPEDRDLARSRPFEAPGTLPGARASEVLHALARKLLLNGPTLPGRLAQAYVSRPAPLPERGDRVRLDPDCALVTVQVSVDGKPGPLTYAVNLRTGLLLAVDPRLAVSLRGLRAPVPLSEALPRVPEGQRAKLVRALVDKAVLVEVR
jgi:hypothetical protein